MWLLAQFLFKELRKGRKNESREKGKPYLLSCLLEQWPFHFHENGKFMATAANSLMNKTSLLSWYDTNPFNSEVKTMSKLKWGHSNQIGHHSHKSLGIMEIQQLDNQWSIPQTGELSWRHNQSEPCSKPGRKYLSLSQAAKVWVLPVYSQPWK